MSPTPVPGIRDQFNLQDFGLNMKGGVGKCSSGRGGGVSPTVQGQLKSSEVQKMALV